MLNEEDIVKIMIDTAEKNAWEHARKDPYFNEERTAKIMAIQTSDFTPLAKMMATEILNNIKQCACD